MDTKGAIANLEQVIRNMEDRQGWTPGGTYDRYWKKDLAREKRRLKELKRVSLKRFTGGGR